MPNIVVCKELGNVEKVVGKMNKAFTILPGQLLVGIIYKGVCRLHFLMSEGYFAIAL